MLTRVFAAFGALLTAAVFASGAAAATLSPDSDPSFVPVAGVRYTRVVNSTEIRVFGSSYDVSHDEALVDNPSSLVQSNVTYDGSGKLSTQTFTVDRIPTTSAPISHTAAN